MGLLFGEVIALAIGLVLQQALPGREQTGAVLLPAVAGAACAIVWVALTWARTPQDGALIWVAALGSALLSALAVGILVRRGRSRADAARLEAVGRA